MATMSEITLLKEFAAQPLEDSPKDDSVLGTLIDAEGSVYGAAARLWRTFASSLSLLADVTESGSSRKMSTIYKNALDIAGTYGSMGDTVETGNRPHSRPIRREAPA